MVLNLFAAMNPSVVFFSVSWENTGQSEMNKARQPEKVMIPILVQRSKSGEQKAFSEDLKKGFGCVNVYACVYKLMQMLICLVVRSLIKRSR